MKQPKNKLLVIGAGPYGLATAALAKSKGLDVTILGKSMSLWKDNMPDGMLLRSDDSWHFDPIYEHTYIKFREISNSKREYENYITRDEFLDYADWFIQQKGLNIDRRFVTKLEHLGHGFKAHCEDGRILEADFVLSAIGYQYFLNLPTELVSLLPRGRFSHSSAWKSFNSLSGKTVLIVGGRQCAYESAALISEQSPGAHVYLTHRKSIPEFTQSNWDFVDQYIGASLETPGWFRKLPAEKKAHISAQFYGEGRLKLEPWLAPRLKKSSIQPFPNSQIASSRELGNGKVHVSLTNGVELEVDHIILCTGFAVDAKQIPFLSRDTILPKLALEGGYPELDEHCQSSVPGLYFAGLVGMKDFGMVFGFVKGAPLAARLVVENLLENSA
jgi:thioredoxin reductase